MLSGTPANLPASVRPGDPLTAELVNTLLDALRVQGRRLAALESALGVGGAGGESNAGRRLPAWVVAVETGSPSNLGNTKYTVRLVGQGPGGDLGPVYPANRMLDGGGVPCVPAVEGDACWIVRGFDAAGAPTSRLYIETERVLTAEC